MVVPWILSSADEIVCWQSYIKRMIQNQYRGKSMRINVKRFLILIVNVIYVCKYKIHLVFFLAKNI